MGKRRYAYQEDKTLENCPNKSEHTESPEGYLAWHSWAEKMGRTHTQTRCPGCNRYAIWLPLGFPVSFVATL